MFIVYEKKQDQKRFSFVCQFGWQFVRTGWRNLICWHWNIDVSRRCCCWQFLFMHFIPSVVKRVAYRFHMFRHFVQILCGCHRFCWSFCLDTLQHGCRMHRWIKTSNMGKQLFFCLYTAYTFACEKR